MHIIVNNLYLAYIKQTYLSIFICALIVMSIYVFSISNVFKKIDNIIYNEFISTYPETKASDKILLIEVDNNDLTKGDEIWANTLQLLLSNHAKAIVFTFLPQQASEQFYQQAIQSNKTFFARRLFKKMRNGTEYNELEKLDKNLELAKLKIGILTAAPYTNGIYSNQQTQINLDGKILPTLEFLVAQNIIKFSEQADYRINFSGGIAKLPSITLQRVLQNGLVSELVQNRVVMIGTHNSNNEINQYMTPITSEDNPVSAFFYHAFALDTLLSEKGIQTTTPLFKIILITIIVLTAFFCYQWLNIKNSLRITCIVLLLYAVLSWITLHFFQIWLPLLELSIAQCLMFFFILRHKAIQEDKILHSTLFDISIKLQEKLSHANFLYTNDHWQQVITMVSQALDTNRMIFLEKVKNDHRVREIKSFNCNLSDINELRRDYEREPYSTAINRNSPIVVQHYFKKSDKKEDEYLLALIFAGEVLGFWAFTITSDKIKLFPNFIALIKNMGFQISEMLHYRKIWQQKQSIEKNVVLNYLSLAGGKINYEILKESVDFLGKRSEILEGIFNNLSTYSVLYDLFGQVIFINNPMKELSQKVGIKPYNITIVEFIANLTGQSLIECRSLMRYVIFDREEVVLPTVALQKKGCFMLSIKPLLIQHNEVKNLISPFQIEGVLCELIDYADLVNKIEIKEQVFERVYYQIRTDFSAILLAIEELKNDSISPKTAAINILSNKTKSVKTKLEQLFIQTDKNTFELLQDNMLCYPIDSYAVLSKFLNHFPTTIQNIKFNVKKPETATIAFVSPNYFKEVIETILEFLVKDTIDNGQINIETQTTHAHVIYKFSNTGFGMPDEDLQKYLEHQNEEITSDRIKKIRQAICHVHKWKGDLQINSVLGEGIAIVMILKIFIEE